jgi:hypothetical protein
VVQKIHEEWGISTSTQTIKRVLKAIRMSELASIPASGGWTTGCGSVRAETS